MEEIADRAASLSARPTVACLEWLDPLMAAGNWMPELIERAGGVNLFGEAGNDDLFGDAGDLVFDGADYSCYWPH